MVLSVHEYVHGLLGTLYTHQLFDSGPLSAESDTPTRNSRGEPNLDAAIRGNGDGTG